MAPVVAGMVVLEFHLAVVFLVASSNLVNATVLLAHGPVRGVGVVLIWLSLSLNRSSGSPPLVPTNAQSQDDNCSEDGETTLESSASGRLGVQVVGIGPGVGGRGHGWLWAWYSYRAVPHRSSKRCGTGEMVPSRGAWCQPGMISRAKSLYLCPCCNTAPVYWYGAP